MHRNFTQKLHYSFTSALLILVPSLVLAASPINTTFFGNLAIKGYDPVAYFTENKAIKGSKKYEYSWQGAQWRFSSKEHLMEFKSDPKKYAPQYGGYCAYAVANNKTANIDPTQFTIVDDKLYLNFNKKINDEWLSDRDNYIKQADQYWPNLIEK